MLFYHVDGGTDLLGHALRWRSRFEIPDDERVPSAVKFQWSPLLFDRSHCQLALSTSSRNAEGAKEEVDDGKSWLLPQNE